ncbi:MAG: hypothetical protein RLZZ78_628 [Armatimonadota bacterium]
MNTAVVVSAMLSLVGSPVHQQTPTTSVPPLRLSAAPLRDIATRLTKATGIAVVVDRKVAQKTMDFVTPGGALDQVVRSESNKLPKDVTVRTLLLPAPRKGGAYDTDAIVSHIASLDSLAQGLNDTPAKPDEILYLGKVITRERAQQLSAQTDLKFVYVFVSTKSDSLSQLSEMQMDMLKRFMALTPEQQTAMVDQQWDMMMNMDPATRKGFFQQAIQSSMGVMQKMQQMPPAQRQQFMDEIRSALPPGLGGPSLPPAP